MNPWGTPFAAPPDRNARTETRHPRRHRDDGHRVRSTRSRGPAGGDHGGPGRSRSRWHTPSKAYCLAEARYADGLAPGQRAQAREQRRLRLLDAARPQHRAARHAPTGPFAVEQAGSGTGRWLVRGGHSRRRPAAAPHVDGRPPGLLAAPRSLRDRQLGQLGLLLKNTVPGAAETGRLPADQLRVPPAAS